MPKRWKTNAVSNHKIAGAKGYAVTITISIAVFGPTFLDMVAPPSYIDDDKHSLIHRIDDLEKTVHNLENQALMCTPKYAIKEEDPFLDIWP